MHSALKHANVLEFLCAVVIDPRQKSSYVPGFYMLLDFAAGGDLFDKIGSYLNRNSIFDIWLMCLFFNDSSGCWRW